MKRVKSNTQEKAKYFLAGANYFHVLSHMKIFLGAAHIVLMPENLVMWGSHCMLVDDMFLGFFRYKILKEFLYIHKTSKCQYYHISSSNLFKLTN